MDAASARQEGPAISGGGGARPWQPTTRFEVLHRGHANRGSLERFVAESYEKAYGARITHYAETLVGVRDPGGAWSAGLGYTLAERAPLFVEHYLDQPIEAAIESCLGAPVARRQVVEVGNLAASEPGAARRVIVRMTALLNDLGRTWVVFTSTRSLLNSFARLRIPSIVLGRADPSRLPGCGQNWGTYYDTDPQVMTANIPRGFVHLRRAGAGVTPARHSRSAVSRPGESD